jgi:hypothetical protein
MAGELEEFMGPSAIADALHVPFHREETSRLNMTKRHVVLTGGVSDQLDV